MLHVSVEEAEPGKQVCRMAAAEDMTPDKQNEHFNGTIQVKDTPVNQAYV